MSENIGASAPEAAENIVESANIESSQELSESTDSNVESEDTSIDESKEVSSDPNQIAKADKAAKSVQAKASTENPGYYKIKVDGEELELSQEEMIKYAQLGKAGQKRMAEAARIKQEAFQLIELLRTDPERVLADPDILGSEKAVVEFAKKILSRELEEEQKSPEVREKERLQRELEREREERRREKEERDRAEYERLVQEQEMKLEEEIQEAFEVTGLPRSPYVLKRFTDVMLSFAKSDKDITPKQAMNIVKKEMHKDIQNLLSVSPEDILENLIGQENLKRVRKRQVAKIKSETSKPSLPVQSSSSVDKQKQNGKEKMSIKDWLRKS